MARYSSFPKTSVPRINRDKPSVRRFCLKSNFLQICVAILVVFLVGLSDIKSGGGRGRRKTRSQHHKLYLPHLLVPRCQHLWPAMTNNVIEQILTIKSSQLEKIVIRMKISAVELSSKHLRWFISSSCIPFRYSCVAVATSVHQTLFSSVLTLITYIFALSVCWYCRCWFLTSGLCCLRMSHIDLRGAVIVKGPSHDVRHEDEVQL